MFGIGKVLGKVNLEASGVVGFWNFKVFFLWIFGWFYVNSFLILRIFVSFLNFNFRLVYYSFSELFVFIIYG